MPSAPKNTCTNCRHSWVLGLKSGSEARACDNRESNHWRHVRMPNATCKQWGGRDD